MLEVLCLWSVQGDFAVCPRISAIMAMSKITWDGEDYMKNSLNDMLRSDEFTDITLVTDDQKQIRAHRVILSACSQVFRNMMRAPTIYPHSQMVIFLRGIQHHEMEMVLKFMYQGEVSIKREEVNEFANVAKSIGIKEFCVEDEDKVERDINGLVTHPSSYIKLKGGKEDELNECIQVKSQIADDKENVKQSVDNNENINLNLESDLNNSVDQFKPNHELIVSSKVGQDLLKYSCDQCKVQFTHKGALKQHILVKHEGISNQCSKCDYKASRKYLLDNHIESNHESVTCDGCSKMFSGRRTLSDHVNKKHKKQNQKVDMNFYLEEGVDTSTPIENNLVFGFGSSIKSEASEPFVFDIEVDDF